MTLVAGTKLSTTSLFLTMGKELWIPQHSYSLAIIDQCYCSRISQGFFVLITDRQNNRDTLTDYTICMEEK